MGNTKFDNPFYLEISRYAIKFARAIYLGEPPPFSSLTYMANATMSLLKFDDLFIGVTCQHVLVHYREIQDSYRNIIFQVAHTQFDPLKHLICEDKERDLVTFDLTPFVDKVEGIDRSSFVEPHCWPPAEVSEDNVICFAGFPGVWREQLNEGHLRFFSFSSGATQLHRVTEDRFVLRIEAENCKVAINRGLVLGPLGGLSGGPVFCWRSRGLLRAELVGFIYEYQDSLDLMYIRAANVLNRDGTFI